MLAALISPGRVMLPDNDTPINVIDRFLLLDGTVKSGQCVLRAANECDGGPIRIAFLTCESMPKNVYACSKHRDLLERAIRMGLAINIR